MSNTIIGRNPVIEALKADREIEKLHICKGTEGSIKKITAMARDKGIPVYFEEKLIFDKLATGNHQGVVAIVSAHRYCDVEDILQLAEQRGEDPFVVILDGVEDPHNLGAIIRTAEAAGAHGVVIPKRRAVGITETAVKASAGASEYMLCARVSNIAQTIDQLKNKGLWIGAADQGGELYYNANLKGAIGLVIGGEGSGVGKLVREKCDFVVSIAMKGKINSLNASNAAAILLYEVQRQRDGR
ncbi:MAG: 23S rRNA (guanosine(2251)-2'-O)-methyltransferase RlmB [Clostridiales bacterium]|nr:23S rRNA (guanosine(2251)-2'-O)-methyltransferase RlmB [Clostridiales bacterium]